MNSIPGRPLWVVKSFTDGDRSNCGHDDDDRNVELISVSAVRYL